ncbi:MAG: DNA-3-methyladenine glycosylase I [Planctomycetota bacterium]
MAKSLTPSLLKGEDGLKRCWWCGDDPLYMQYHDHEWGQIVTDDRRLFEKICLEGFQAGLSWITILKKRENFRDAFDDFDMETVAKFNQRNVNRLVKNAGIIRHRGKIESTINNAQRAIELLDEYDSLFDYFQQFRPAKTRAVRRRSQVPATTDESTRMSKDLKKRGWSFIGPTTCYAFMQAMGLVNDHVVGCHVR